MNGEALESLSRDKVLLQALLAPSVPTASPHPLPAYPSVIIPDT